MKLEVGMYVRTKVGIFKIRKITKDLAYWKHEKRVLELDRNIPEYNYRFSFYKDESIFKGAKFKDNIIDLIEVGDYVNGSRVVYFMIDEEKSINEGIDEKIGVVVEEEWEGKKYLTKDIKTIVTKEQFKANEYVVE